MIAYHNRPDVKKLYLERVLAHQNADEIIKGQYWENGKGCAVGCTIYGDDHARYETELGIPSILARLEDRIFEGLSLELAKTWPARFLEAINVGANLSLIWDKFVSRILTDPVGGAIQYAKTEEQLKIIQRVSDLYEARIAGLDVDTQEFKDAGLAAHSLARAAYVADNYDVAAFALADATAYARASDYVVCRNVAYYFAGAYASQTSRERAYVFQSELLLELLRAAK